MVKYLHRANSYQHPLEFAADMRRIITETYRYTMPKDPLVDLAGKLQSEFEMCFAKIDFSVSSQAKPSLKIRKQAPSFGTILA